ncbi:hypothetical protein [Streptomyces sp. NPDC047841]|uniref:hypothetical protein n=1 Tax=Streptomyces sp. NPDC047841 TaxID=3154708 RepID=UPI0034546A82
MAWLAERGEDAYALAWVAEGSQPGAWMEAEAPRAGESGVARTGADLTRVTLEEVTHGRAETLRRWVQLDDGVRQLAVLTAEPGGLREHTPGDLAADRPCNAWCREEGTLGPDGRRGERADRPEANRGSNDEPLTQVTSRARA